MFENRITTPSHENNGEGNGVLHETLPGTGTLPSGLLGDAATPEGERTLNGPPDGAGPGAGPDLASRAASAAGDAAPRADGRSDDGRFYFKNPGGPGNPFARTVALLKKTLLKMVPPERLERMLEPILQMAEQGDKQALKLILPYLLGKPQIEPHPDRLDFLEWQTLREAAGWMQDVKSILALPSGTFALDLVRDMQPDMDRLRAREMGFAFRAQGKTKENVMEHLSDPVNGLGKLHKEMARQQTGSQKKKKQRRR
jgi:hypothetical protein